MTGTRCHDHLERERRSPLSPRPTFSLAGLVPGARLVKAFNTLAQPRG
jgi:hypothetical protein